MKSARLTNAMRDKIVSAVLEKVVKPKEEELNAKFKEALKSYLLSQIPDGFPKDSKFAFKPDSIDINLYTNKDGYSRLGYRRIENEAKLPVACSTKYTDYGFDIELDVDSGWGATFDAMMKEEGDLHERGAELVAELNRLLVGCTTVKQVLEAYPDIEQYVVLDIEKSLPVPRDFAKLTSLLRG